MNRWTTRCGICGKPYRRLQDGDMCQCGPGDELLYQKWSQSLTECPDGVLHTVDECIIEEED